MARKRKVNWAALFERVPNHWRPDPHRRGRAIPSKKVYQRKPRTPVRGFLCKIAQG
jgi:hypothetical protein